VLKKRHWIKNSKRPVFNAGNGIRIGNAHKEFLELADLLNIPVVVGWNSEDCMWVDHPLYAGRPGNFGDRPGNFTVQNSDLLLSVGSRLSLRQVGFNYKGWAREAFTIVNDMGPVLEVEDKPQTIGILTNDFHIFRSMLIAKRVGYTQVYPISARSNRVLYLHMLVRETFAIFKYKFLEYI